MLTTRPFIHELSTAERAELMRNEWASQNRFQHQFGHDTADLSCEPFATELRDQVLRQLQLKGVINAPVELSKLHEYLTDEQKEYGFNDGVNKVSTYLYDTDEAFQASYLRFVKECLRPYFPYPFYFQATPTVRIHCPNGKNNHHYPRYHTDINYGHPPQEINLWIPLTAPQGEQRHGFRLMSLADSRKTLEAFGYDFAPFIEKAVGDPAFNQGLHAVSPQVETPFGKLLAFDSRCIHTGEPMLQHTRASIDIRLIPVEDYEAMPVIYQGVGRRKIIYQPGQAYHPVSSDKL